MTMYGMLFGSNPQSDVILATLGLTKDSVGRFRDCHVANGKIVVYTRNGGGNRNCWHEDAGFIGNENCGGESRIVEVDEYTQSGPIVKTGNRVMETQWTCPTPDSEQCAVLDA